MARKPRAAAQAAAASIRTPAPLILENSDDEMLDVQPSNRSTPQEDHNDAAVEEEEEEVEEVEEGDGTPARDSDVPSRRSTPLRAGRNSAVPRKRRPGRPPRNPRPDDDLQDDVHSDAATPRKRGRGRGGGGGRWANRVRGGGPSHVTQVPIDKEGNMMNVIDDEVDLPEDPEGEQKVDKMGRLQGGREYRVRTFTLYGRGDRLYMLSTEPARCIGFRDSYLFFQKHKLLYKIIIGEEAKRDLIDRDLIPHSYKGRAIGVVTARSVFREFGARIVIGGKKVMDDYGVQAARGRGDVEGELAVPDDRLPAVGEPYNRNQYVAWHGASSVYHSGAPSVPMQNGKLPEGKKRKIQVTGDNWMFEHAREATRFNSMLSNERVANTVGIFDIQCSKFQYPKTMQPSHARWEDMLDSTLQQLGTDPGGNGVLTHKTSHEDPTTADVEETIFKPLPEVYQRNFMIHDVHLQGAPSTSMGLPGLDSGTHDIGVEGVLGIDRDILEELPPGCHEALEAAQSREFEWKSQWLAEAVDGNRATLLGTHLWTA